LIRSVRSAALCAALTLLAPGIAQAATHTVASGETIASIAAREHVEPAQLARLNELQGSATAPLMPGTVLALDAADRPVSATAMPAQSEDVRAQLKAIEVASAPTASADVDMWGASGSAAAAESPMKRLASRILQRTSAIAGDLTSSALHFIGTPYVFGGTSTAGFDCSGYVQHVFAMLGIRLPRTADAQYYAAHPVAEVKAGDLVFFQTYLPGPSHVGIYLGGGKFVHSASHGVTVSRLSEPYWATRYLGARRVASAG